MSLEEKNIDKPRTKPAEVRLEELMNAAETLFLEKGFDATTVSDIVKQAGVAKGTYYHYFTAKQIFSTHCELDIWIGILIKLSKQWQAAKFKIFALN
ncbi:TetR/AcrR family transcriptional regulator [Proteus mirabilis]|uniref:TetR/AcrR family transcriptional regulator n=1 Tax=Proteus mirabilis TaxID=584 RepID=A0ABD5LS43_PROMI